MSYSALQNNQVFYSGLNSSYSIDNNPIILTNIAVKNNQILNLMTCSEGELDFEPDFGSMTPKLLFEQPTAINDWMIGNYLFVAIAKWIPQIKIDFKQSIIQMLDDGVYYIGLYYSIDGLVGGNQVDFRFQT